MLKKLLKNILPSFYLDHIHKSKVDKQVLENYENWRLKVLNEWEIAGKELPPPHAIKQKVISDYQKKYNIKILVETGTLHGDMIEAQKRSFKKVYSIELDKKLHLEAADRFKYDRNVKLVLGDSGVKIFDLIKEISYQSIFWLDGHYSGTYTALGNVECPIYGEIDGVFSGSINNHILLVDDARFFIGQNSYPTKEELYSYILKYNPKYKMNIEADIIRFQVN